MYERFKHSVLLVCLGIVFVAVTPFEDQFPWLVGCLFIAFWGYDMLIEIKFGKGFLKTKRQIFLAILISIIALMYFLPSDVRSLEVVVTADKVLNWVFLVVVCFFDRDDDNRGDKDNGKKVDRKKLRWIPEGT